jgi:hypothetical protein
MSFFKKLFTRAAGQKDEATPLPEPDAEALPRAETESESPAEPVPAEVIQPPDDIVADEVHSVPETRLHQAQTR